MKNIYYLVHGWTAEAFICPFNGMACCYMEMKSISYLVHGWTAEEFVCPFNSMAHCDGFCAVTDACDQNNRNSRYTLPVNKYLLKKTKCN